MASTLLFYFAYDPADGGLFWIAQGSTLPVTPAEDNPPRLTAQSLVNGISQMEANGYKAERVEVTRKGWDQLREDAVANGWPDIGEPSELGARLTGVPVVCVDY